MELIKKGAEANIYVDEWYGRTVILKKRIPKAYRNPTLDLRIRRSRTIREAQLLHDAKLAGVSTPTVYVVDVEDMTMVMGYINGVRVKEALDLMGVGDRVRLCRHVGRLIGRLHKAGIIHGDLTTSNIIVAEDGVVYFIDFGLGGYSREVEDWGVDLLLLRRALLSTHYHYAKECSEAELSGYAEVVGEALAAEVSTRMDEIARRGRYAPGRRVIESRRKKTSRQNSDLPASNT